MALSAAMMNSIDVKPFRFAVRLGPYQSDWRCVCERDRKDA
jgi:hypothetical protein